MKEYVYSYARIYLYMSDDTPMLISRWECKIFCITILLVKEAYLFANTMEPLIHSSIPSKVHTCDQSHTDSSSSTTSKRKSLRRMRIYPVLPRWTTSETQTMHELSGCHVDTLNLPQNCNTDLTLTRTALHIADCSSTSISQIQSPVSLLNIKTAIPAVHASQLQ